MSDLGLPSKDSISNAIAPLAFRSLNSGRNFAAGQTIKVFFFPALDTQEQPYKPYTQAEIAGRASVGIDIAQINSSFQAVNTADRARVFANVFGTWS